MESRTGLHLSKTALSPPTQMARFLEAAPREGISTSETPLHPEDLFEANEIFTSHSGIKVTPVARFEDRRLDAPGPITRQVMDLMDNITHFRDDRFRHWFQQL